MELLFLGTGAGIPSKERNVSAIALSMQQEINHTWLFDCGEATQHQILHSSIKPRKINKIFITHLHGDHIFGLPGVLSSRSFQGGDEPLTIYGPKGIKTFIKTSLAISDTHLSYPLHIHEYTEGKLFEDHTFRVFVKKLKHGVPSYGFRIEERDSPGELLVSKLKEIGVQPGPIYKEIKEHKQTILSDGRLINRSDYIGEQKKGRIICILGDTRETKENVDFIRNANILVHEATFGKEKQQLAHLYFHSTTIDAAKLAKSGDVQNLLLTHLSSRYQKKDYPNLLREARSIFTNTELVYDFYRFPIQQNN